jgi:hypothetical protein
MSGWRLLPGDSALGAYSLYSTAQAVVVTRGLMLDMIMLCPPKVPGTVMEHTKQASSHETTARHYIKHSACINRNESVAALIARTCGTARPRGLLRRGGGGGGGGAC